MILLGDNTIRKFLNKSNTFEDYDKQYKSLENCVINFVNKLKNRITKKKIIVKNFLKNKIRNMKYKNLIKNQPCNENDLYTLEKYEKSNKNNIYLIDIKLNKKWWFTIETISKLLCNNLSYFDSECYDVNCKEPVNPYTNKILTTGQLISLYEQLNKRVNVHKLIVLYRMANFRLNKFLKLYNDDIVNNCYKYNLESLDNEGLLTILHNLFYEYDIKYVNADKLDLANNTTKNDTYLLIKECCLTYKKHQFTKLKMFIDKYKYIIKRASRNFNNTNNTNNTNNMDIDTICEGLNNTYIEIDFACDESLDWTTDEDNANDLENLDTN
tara:strand:- start:202 stop:1179 length:978 start_codon:yes stop_codon:yes gene_type:complete